MNGVAGEKFTFMDFLKQVFSIGYAMLILWKIVNMYKCLIMCFFLLPEGTPDIKKMASSDRKFLYFLEVFY